MTTTKPTVVDLSHYQSTVDFSRMKAAGVVGVILKCSEGTSYVDPTFAQRKADAPKAGLAVSSYHYLKSGDVKGQMAHYLDACKPVAGERLVLDVEDPDLTIADVHGAVQALLDAGNGLQITIYGGSVVKQLLGSGPDDFLARNTSLWLAQYTAGTPSWPTAVWPQWSLWQYSSSGQVSGVSGQCDVNTFNGSDDNCAKWLGPAVAPAPSPTPSVTPTITVHLDADQPVKMKLTFGGNVTVEN